MVDLESKIMSDASREEVRRGDSDWRRGEVKRGKVRREEEMLDAVGELTCLGPGMILPCNSISDSVSRASVAAMPPPIIQLVRDLKKGKQEHCMYVEKSLPTCMCMCVCVCVCVTLRTYH